MKAASAKKVKAASKTSRQAAPTPPGRVQPTGCTPATEATAPAPAADTAPLGPPAELAPQPVRLAVEGLPAATVCVAGCFNEWSMTATPMTALAPGCWSVELSLPPGRYEYLLVVDGQWQTDPCCAARVANPYGTENCVLEVRSPA